MQRYSFATLSLIAQTAAASYWQPTAGTPWQIVLSDPLQAPYPSGIQAIDGDLYANNASTWADIKASGIKTICYFSAGSFEDWRPDASQFVKGEDYGEPLKGWPHEWWINTKSQNVRNIMKARLDLAAQKGCDAVDPDNMDVYENGGGGFGLTEDDAVDYVTFIATEAHNRNMACGLKNAGDIIDRVLDVVQFQVNEQCVQYGECSTFQPFISANKPVFNIEYTKTDDTIPDAKDISKDCTNPDSQGFSTLIKHMNLNEWLISCNTTAKAAANTTSSPAPTTAAAAATFTGAGTRFSAVGTLSALAVLAAGMTML